VLDMCILAGCDYLPSLPGMGIKRAHSFIRRFKSAKGVSGILYPYVFVRLDALDLTKAFECGYSRVVWTAKCCFSVSRSAPCVLDKTVHHSCHVCAHIVDYPLARWWLKRDLVMVKLRPHTLSPELSNMHYKT
jgi:hypothetical protein